jgi:Family of unknown function (DUF5675)
MKLKLVRDTFTANSTVGKLFVDGVYECNTLEDVVRTGPKVYGKTAIPEGIYFIIIDYSNHFGKDMPHVLDVPNFQGIRIHSGNAPDDTEGCILVGMNRKIDWVGQARLAFEHLMLKLDAVDFNKEQITLEVTHV